ncbi:MAG TPA: hypothetical protein VGR02_06240 [Thermoanaerobaculia bacterium]|nr:hypothetical protein [Thermoanaerobaculia bacterium]
MRSMLLGLLFAAAPLLLAENPAAAIPQAVKALEQLRAGSDAGPFSWTAAYDN